tara:strand:- start:8483 stop:8788 length:306 start_codon:yes stop_codon:yes gene_type:complete
MRRINTLLIAGLFLSSQVTAADAITQEIIDRCREQSGEFGSILVKSCVDMDVDAYAALQKYPAKHQPIIDRCMKESLEFGYILVKSCVDMDIEAEKALEAY